MLKTILLNQEEIKTDAMLDLSLKLGVAIDPNFPEEQRILYAAQLISVFSKVGNTYNIEDMTDVKLSDFISTLTVAVAEAQKISLSYSINKEDQ